MFPQNEISYVHSYISAPGPPADVRCGSLAKKSLNVTWSMPDDPNGVIRGYNVSWKKIRNKNEKLEDGPGGPFENEFTSMKNLTNIGGGELGKSV